MLKEYSEISQRYLEHIDIDYDLLLCKNNNCNIESHRTAIDIFCRDISNALKRVGETAFLSKMSAKKTKYNICGWYDFVKPLHSEAREAFLQWRANAKPRHGALFDKMKQSRARFKYALRSCKRDEERIQADNLANKLLQKDDKMFWKEVKKINASGGKTLADCIDGVSGDQKICDMWKGKYDDLLNSNKDVIDRDFVLSEMNKITNEPVRFECTEVKNALKSLNNGKSAGLDLLCGEHFKYAHSSISIFISMLFNSIISHGYIPSEIMQTAICPIVKDKRGSLTDSSNYRPVAITTVFSKVLETIFVNKYLHLLNTTDNQYGFKEKHSTDLCIFTLKEIIEHYNRRSSPVYVCFIDASKAFDRLNHWTLFKKLLIRNIPLLMVRMFLRWYSLQEFCVRWANCTSSSFYTSNGVRQGGVVSPLFFNIYMNNLSSALTKSNLGCRYNGLVINHLFYADDSCLMATTPRALQSLIDICTSYGIGHNIIYNPKKTMCMCFKPSRNINLRIPIVYFNGAILKFVEEVKYLGVFISNDLTDGRDMNRHTRFLYCKGNLLTRKFFQCSYNVKRKLFLTFCNNVYGGHLWTNFKLSDFNKVKVAYNNVYRSLFFVERGTSVTWSMLLNHVDSFKVSFRKMIFRFRKRLLTSHNFIIYTIINSASFKNTSSTMSLWKKELF